VKSFKRVIPRVLLFAAFVLQVAAADTPRVPREQQEDFLMKSKVISKKSAGRGITDSEHAIASDGALTHDAHIQCVDEHASTFTSSKGTELNFKDTYKFNVAAYRLDKMMNLGMVPASVERKVGGKTCAMTWWVDGTWMTELERKAKNLEPPDQDSWNRQMYVVRVFDQLIFNTDRNLGNLVIDKNWTIWMIDHTRAFRIQPTLMNAKNLVKCDRHLLAELRKLDEGSLRAEMKGFLNNTEISAMLKRRDLIVKFFEEEIASKGEAQVMYDVPAR
jgi:hypothetical protein